MPLVRIALTGGIATGKSHVLRLLAARGVPTIDADVIARDVVRQGSPALAAIAKRFGPAALSPDGSLDRRAVAAMVFSDPAARHDLETIIHPLVYDAIRTWFAALDISGAPFAVADIPLLYETGHAGDFDRVIVTAAPPDVQVRRIMARDGLTDAEAGARLTAQLPSPDKERRADFVIQTDGTFEDTERQVDEIYRSLSRPGPAAGKPY